MERFLKIVDEYEEIGRDTDTALHIIPNLYDVIVQLLNREDSFRIQIQKLEVLNQKLNDVTKEKINLEKQLRVARGMIDEEKAKLKRSEEERNRVEHHLETVRELLMKDSNKINDETKEKLNLLSTRQSLDALNDRLDTITELETTGSVLSNLSYTRDEDDLLSSSGTETRSQKRSSLNPAGYTKTKRQKTGAVALDRNECLVATTTVTVGHSGPVSAKSVIETLKPHHSNRGPDAYTPSAPPLTDSDTENDHCKTPTNKPYNAGVPFSMNLINTRPHNFQQKAMIKSELCNVCCKRLRFSAIGVKCRDCKAVCHVLCKDSVPVPCVPVHTPTTKEGFGTIANYTPQVQTMVPSLVVHCIKEIEARGLTEIGLYRIPGSDREVKNLMEKFLRGRGVPNLSKIDDVHVICGCLKYFLRSLTEPLVTHGKWKEFSKASDLRDESERKARFYQLISELPQPNKHTLAYLIIHLQKVAESPDCKMPIPNLAKMFGPSVVTRVDPDNNALAETNQANKIMAELLSLPTDYWETFLKGSEVKGSENGMPKTPSTNSLMNFFSPMRGKSGKKYFDTP